MEIKYKVIEKLKKENISIKDFQYALSIGNSVMTRLRQNTPIRIDTLGKICEYFQCPIQDIVEIKFDKKAKKKAELENQLKEIQAKLDSLQ